MVDLYAELKLAPENQIRLLRILPTAESESLACELQVVDLQPKLEYVALSYTWGSPTALTDEGAEALSSKPSFPLLCRAKSVTADQLHSTWHQILITKNLQAFLERARDNDSHVAKSYWIDAIGIDQKDPVERCRQVRMMGTIYRSAAIVYAWLGEEYDNAGIAFELITALVSRCTATERRERIKGLMDITPRSLDKPGLTEELGICADGNAWKSLAKLFQRRYFTRAWIIQEITLANTMVALCGSHAVDWVAITIVSEFLAVTSWSRWISSLPGSHPSSHGVPNILDANRSTPTLLYSLIRFRRFTCADPRDKVYSLLSITGESTLEKNRLVPVYGERSVAETYTLAAIQILEDSDDLLLLSCAEGDNFQKIPSLPSWAPDWSCTRAIGLGVTGYKRFAAAGTLSRTLHIDEWNRRLTIKGFRLDDIVAIGETKETILDKKPFPLLLQILEEMPHMYHTGQSRAEVMWRTLITDTAGVPPSCPAPDSYRSAYVSWINSKLLACVQDTLRSIQDPAFIESIVEFAAAENSGSPVSFNSTSGLHGTALPETRRDSIDSDAFETTFSHARHLRLFLTGRQYLGVGPEGLLEHDSVWIIPGLRVPLVLREVDSHTFQVVGGAYVHGFMQGEALMSGPYFRDITLL
ncbi:heterokaryon incompatibility protein-domain-containing protein [Alternaria alternata]|nr:heterokaryon incompatibility protein-domain-containing protein [Alternaria alternata]